MKLSEVENYGCNVGLDYVTLDNGFDQDTLVEPREGVIGSVRGGIC